jgi:hypothetical protein
MVGNAVLVTTAVAVAVVFLGLGLFRGGSRSLVDLTGSNGSLSRGSRCRSSLCWGSRSSIDRGASGSSVVVVVVLVRAMPMAATMVAATTVTVVFLGRFRGGSRSLVDLASTNGSLSRSSRCRSSLGRGSSGGIGRGASSSSVVVVVLVRAMPMAATMVAATAAGTVVFLGLGLLRGGGAVLACSDHISELARNLFESLRVLEFADIVFDGLLASLELHIGIAGEERVRLFKVVSKNTGRSNDNSGEEGDGCRETHSDSV